VRRALPAAELVVLPVSDGGDGLLDAVLSSDARRDVVTVTGPRGTPVQAPLGWLDASTALCESAAACGLALLKKEERHPTRTTSRGVGELIAAAVRGGARTVIVGLGGSATVDGGTGAARALGWRFLDKDGNDLPEGGGSLIHLKDVVAGPAPAAKVVALTDVTAPLTGRRGAAAVFAPQKGAGPAEVELLAAALERLQAVMGGGPRGVWMATVPGSGAAGGLGAGLVWFAGAELVGGAAWVLDRLDAGAAIARADVVITAEGRVDHTSLVGKVTGELVRRARRARKPVLVLAAAAEPELDLPVRHARGRLVDAAALSALAEQAARDGFAVSPG
jgi:glycerate kinase